MSDEQQQDETSGADEAEHRDSEAPEGARRGPPSSLGAAAARATGGDREAARRAASLTAASAEDEVDPELLGLSRGGGGRETVLRPILMLMVLALGVYILSDWREEVSYYFSDSSPITLGDVTDYPSKVEEEAGWQPSIPHNRYVKLSGIPTRRTISKQYTYSKLVGGEVYIEAAREDAHLSELEREARGEVRGETDRTYFDGAGRALSFSAMPKRYETLRQYYSASYGMAFCVDVDARAREQLVQQRREAIKQTWRKAWEELSEEERARHKRMPEPTEAEIAELLRDHPVCVDAWLIQAGKKPSDHLWYVVLSGLFLAFMVLDVVILVRWVMRALRRD